MPPFVRESYSLLERLHAKRVEAKLATSFLQPQAWECVSVATTLGAKRRRLC